MFDHEGWTPEKDQPRGRNVELITLDALRKIATEAAELSDINWDYVTPQLTSMERSMKDLQQTRGPIEAQYTEWLAEYERTGSLEVFFDMYTTAQLLVKGYWAEAMYNRVQAIVEMTK